jgi:hypothetical protein
VAVTPDAVLATDGLGLMATAGFFVPAAVLVAVVVGAVMRDRRLARTCSTTRACAAMRLDGGTPSPPTCRPAVSSEGSRTRSSPSSCRSASPRPTSSSTTAASGATPARAASASAETTSDSGGNLGDSRARCSARVAELAASGACASVRSIMVSG